MYVNKYNRNHSNFGIQLLRILLAFWVVTAHCYYPAYSKNILHFYKSNKFHVPTFLLITYYFYYNKLIKKDITKINQRLVRLFIPYIIWPFIFLLINNLCHNLFDFQQFYRKINAKDYFIQIIIGRGYYSYFWFMNILLFGTFLFTIISFIFHKHFLFILQLLGLISYRTHLSSFYNYLTIKDFAFVQTELILFIEMMPVSVIGLTFGAKNIMYILKNQYIKHIIIQVFLLYYVINLDIFREHQGFLYQPIEKNTIGAINLFIIFSIFPFENVLNQRIIDIIKIFSNHTGGIYYLHAFSQFYLGKKIIFVKNKTLFGCFIIIIFCYFICFFGNKLFKKTILTNLFI